MMTKLDRIVALIAALLFGMFGCVDGGLVVGDDDVADGDDDDAGDDDTADDDTEDDDTADDDTGDDDAVPPTPGITFNVPSGDLGGQYSYTAEVFCGMEESSPTISAAGDANWDAWLGFSLGATPGDSEHVENLVLTWYSPWPWAQAEGGTECYVDTIDGWPAVTGTFECLGITPHGGGMWDPHDIVDGTIRCN